MPLRRSALSVRPCEDPWGTLLHLEVGYSRAPYEAPKEGQTPRSRRSKVTSVPTANLRTEILDFRGFDPSRILILRGGTLMSIGNFPESLRRAIFVGIILVGRLGLPEPLYTYIYIYIMYTHVCTHIYIYIYTYIYIYIYILLSRQA